MVYSASLAERVRQALRSQRRITEKTLFGGVGFMLQGNLLVCVWQSSLIVRLGAEQATVALDQAHVHPFDVTGRPMKGWIMIEPDGLETDEQLGDWLTLALKFVKTLPAK